LALAGAVWQGILGAAWGLALGQVIGAVVLVVLSHRAMALERVSPVMVPGLAHEQST
jgi:hypothetical protein